VGEWDGFEAVYRAAHGPVLRFLRRRLPPGDAEDATAEVFVVAWRRWGEQRGEPLPWLYGIARLVAANHRRSTGRSQELWKRLDAVADRGTEESAEETALERMDAAKALAGLSDTDREVLMLVSWDGLEPAEAARVMGRSRATFAVQLHRARVRLERIVAQTGAPVGESQVMAPQGRSR
jgi:RNA polymerase sigma-70 factor (ECF subfamily)